jgi:hypothetical protein
MRLLALGILASSSWAMAQTKISGSLECASPAFHRVMEVGDRASHTMALSQRACVWPLPLKIEGAISKQDFLYLFTDAREDGARETGYNTLVMSNGDRIFMHYAGWLKNNGQRPASSVVTFADTFAGTFAFSGGTGKFLGIYGNGTSVSHGAADGKMTVRVEGQYTLPRFQ